MWMEKTEATRSPNDARLMGGLYDDPLERDEATDATIVTTRRALLRVALVAAETASRFTRESIATDPVAWLLAPRRLFDGRPALEACLEREDCLRAVLLHGLSIGMDADPGLVDDLAMDDDPDALQEPDPSIDARGRMRTDHRPDARASRLWTSYLVRRSEDGVVHAFDAIVAKDLAQVEDRIRTRYGYSLFDSIEIVEGFDPDSPLAEALVAPALADTLRQVASDPTSPLAEGLSISVQQRFAE